MCPSIISRKQKKSVKSRKIRVEKKFAIISCHYKVPAITIFALLPPQSNLRPVEPALVSTKFQHSAALSRARVYLWYRWHLAAMADNNGSSLDSPNFFEGVEKLLEIWFAPSPSADLRKIPRWDDGMIGWKNYWVWENRLFFCCVLWMCCWPLQLELSIFRAPETATRVCADEPWKRLSARLEWCVNDIDYFCCAKRISCERRNFRNIMQCLCASSCVFHFFFRRLYNYAFIDSACV